MTEVIIAIVGTVVALFAAFLGGFKFQRYRSGERKAKEALKAEREAATVVQKANDDVAKINAGDDPTGDTVKWLDSILDED